MIASTGAFMLNFEFMMKRDIFIRLVISKMFDATLGEYCGIVSNHGHKGDEITLICLVKSKF